MLRIFVNKVGMELVSKDIDPFYYGIDFHFYQTIIRKWYVAEMVKAENAAGYAINKFTDNNPYNNKLLFSWGLGIDLVTYYDLVIRFEYAFTSIWTNGFYFGFGIPI